MYKVNAIGFSGERYFVEDILYCKFMGQKYVATSICRIFLSNLDIILIIIVIC